MKNTTKSIFIIMSLLILGFVLGVSSSSLFMRHRIKKIRHHRSLIHPIKRIIEPHENQRLAVDKILKKHQEKMNIVHGKHLKQIELYMDTLIIELKPILEPEQYNRLKRKLKKIKKRFKPHHPPGHPEPGIYNNPHCPPAADEKETPENPQHRKK